MIKVSILIVSYNVRSYLAHALDSILQSNYKDIEVIIIDNNSFDETKKYIDNKYKPYAQIKIISNNDNIGFGKAINQASKIASGDYFLILNPDTLIEEDTIPTLVKYLEKNDKVGMVGPKILNSDGTLQLACKRSFPNIQVAIPKILGFDRMFPKSKWAGKYNLTYLDPEKIHKVDAISGSCMMIRSMLFNSVKGFDERFFMYGEDLDLCRRVWDADYEVHYNPKTKIIHYKGKSVETSPYDGRHAFYESMKIYVDKYYSKTMGLLTRFLINTGINIRKIISSINDKRSLIISIGLDTIFISSAFLIAMKMRFNNFSPLFESKGLVPFIYVILWISVGSLFQLYSRYILSYSRALISTITGFLIAVLFTYFFNQYAYSRIMIVIASIAIALIVPTWRVFLHYLISRGVFNGLGNSKSIIFSRKTLIAGADKEGIRIAENIVKRFDSGLELIGFIDEKYPENDMDFPIPFIGNIKDLRQITKKHKICEIIFSITSFTNKQILDFMDSTKDLRIIYRMVPKEQEILLGKTNIEDIGGIAFVNIEYNLFYRLHRISKRIFDIIIATILILFFCPIMLCYWLLKKHMHVEFWGENGKVIKTFIFNSNNKFIRDLPLLITVFFGKLSLVGSSMIELDENDPKLLCQPGITGLERIRNIKFKTNARRAVEHYYVQNQNIKLDLEIIIKTIMNG